MEGMNISFAQYFTVDDSTGINATIDGIQMSIPLDPANRHFSEIMRQVEEGTLVIQEAELQPE